EVLRTPGTGSLTLSGCSVHCARKNRKPHAPITAAPAIDPPSSAQAAAISEKTARKPWPCRISRRTKFSARPFSVLNASGATKKQRHAVQPMVSEARMSARPWENRDMGHCLARFAAPPADLRTSPEGGSGRAGQRGKARAILDDADRRRLVQDRQQFVEPGRL